MVVLIFEGQLRLLFFSWIQDGVHLDKWIADRMQLVKIRHSGNRCKNYFFKEVLNDRRIRQQDSPARVRLPI